MFTDFLKNGPNELIDKTQEILADPKGYMDEHKDELKNMASYVGENKKNGGKGTLRDKQGGKKAKWFKEEEKKAKKE